MKLIRVNSYEELSRKAADLIAAQILLKPDCVLGLATGSTPIGTYQNLVQKYQAGDLDFSQVTTFNLDEYLGLTGDHPQSYRYFMQSNLFDHVNLRPQCTHVPDGCAEDPAAYGAAYDQAILDHGGIDLQLLGIGNNGHIAFNEPGDCFIRETHTVELKQSTIEANKRFFNSIDEVPTRAITLGIGSIMQAKKVLLIADGPAKKEAIEKSFFGPICPEVPAPVLQLHPDLTVICNVD